ncbi:copper amine oxidase N-terminal domain-containing protein [Ammoniphilus sp. YIM 78166]|uniref:copper amine oxidase N-terminal domain-containing protein n=1 Tax=Ammoniphilus sp. YIM 78166 TaxID=1644106 RepID=UPI00106F6243|nr:copper amine oxidase N-terminal domain-containing protein [Ammoniphilus sp. YIM 78166]
MINGVPQRYDQPPMMVQNRTLVPLRGIFEALGAEVQWQAETETVIATKGELMITLRKGAKEALVNDQWVPLDVAAQPVNGRMMVPARFVSEAMGARVEWDSKALLVKITAE